MTDTSSSILEEKLYTIKELADLLGISYTTARRYVYAGIIPAHKMRGRILVPKANILRALSESQILRSACRR